MGMKRKQMVLRQKEYFEQKLKERVSFLSGKGIKSPKADKDTIVKKFKANIKAINKRLKFIADNDKITEDMKKIKAERAAAPKQEQEGAKAEKPKKGPEEGKGKKAKAEKKPGPPKAQDGGKGQKPAESPEEGKVMAKKKIEETTGKPTAEVKVEK